MALYCPQGSGTLRQKLTICIFCIFFTYMQKTCDVAGKAILAKKIAEKVRKSRQNVNRDKSA